MDRELKKKAIKVGLYLSYKGGKKFDPSGKSEAEMERIIETDASQMITSIEEQIDDMEREVLDRKGM